MPHPQSSVHRDDRPGDVPRLLAGQEALSGLVSGAVVSSTKLLALHPLDTIKIRLQHKEFQRDQLFGNLFDGVVPPLLISAPSGALFFSCKDSVQVHAVTFPLPLPLPLCHLLHGVIEIQSPCNHATCQHHVRIRYTVGSLSRACVCDMTAAHVLVRAVAAQAVLSPTLGSKVATIVAVFATQFPYCESVDRHGMLD